MSRARLNSTAIRDPSWLHWVATLPLLAGHVAGVPGCLELAIIICLTVAFGMWMRTRSVLVMPVQVRIAYAGLLAIGIAPGMFWIYIVQIAGTAAMVLFGYCPLVRVLTLFPWNRTEPITKPWLTRLIWSAAPGGLVDLSQGRAAPAACSCSCSPAACAMPYVSDARPA